MKKVYYQLRMTQRAPLRVGNAGSERTDSDLMLDKRGMPFIPGSSIAGVLRALIPDAKNRAGKSVRDSLFGPSLHDGADALENSRLLISDAYLYGCKEAAGPDVTITGRDGVAVDEWGKALNKYDFEVAESGGEYISVIEWSGSEEEEADDLKTYFEPLLADLMEEGVSFGARTSRGFGEMAVKVGRMSFDAAVAGDSERWLAFDAFAKTGNEWEELTAAPGASREKRSVIEMEIEINGSFSVRVPTARTELTKEGMAPDAIPLKNAKQKPVIPGTSWAGVFRHHMNGLAQKAGIADRAGVDALFGKMKDGAHKKSSISFNETEISGGSERVITRNAVDRFTAAPKNTGLFATQNCYGGTGLLKITYAKDAMTPLRRQLLSLAIIDLQTGLLTVGGECGIGRGRIAVNLIRVDGEDRTEQFKKIVGSSETQNPVDFLEV